MNFKKIINPLFTPVPSIHWGVFRIGIALTAIVQYGCLQKGLMDLFGKYGYFQQELMDTILPAYQPRLAWIANGLQVTDNQEVMFIKIIYGLFLSSCFLLMIGFCTRLTACVCFFLQLCFIGTGYAYTYGFDYFMAASFFYCIFFPVQTNLSIDAFLYKNLNPSDSYFYTFWLRAHLACIYFFSGFAKSLGNTWWNGEAIWRSLMSLEFKIFDCSFLAQVPWLAQFFCLFTLFIEFFYPIGINFKKTRRFWLCSIIMLHLGIAIFMGLWFFASIMIIWNVCAYAPISIAWSIPKGYKWGRTQLNL